MSGLYLSGAGKIFFVPIIETALPEQGTLLERNFFPEAGKPMSRNYRDFAGAAWALSRISLMPVLLSESSVNAPPTACQESLEISSILCETSV
jgi:hypothetical protein